MITPRLATYCMERWNGSTWEPFPTRVADKQGFRLLHHNADAEVVVSRAGTYRVARGNSYTRPFPVAHGKSVVFGFHGYVRTA